MTGEHFSKKKERKNELAHIFSIMSVRIYLNTDDGKYPVDVSLDSSVNRLKETIRVVPKD